MRGLLEWMPRAALAALLAAGAAQARAAAAVQSYPSKPIRILESPVTPHQSRVTLFHSAFTPIDRMTLPHLADSERRSLASSSGELPTGSASSLMTS